MIVRPVAAFAVVFGTSVAGALSPAAHAAAAPSAAAREVRTTWTSEVGVERPEAVTYVPERDELLVASPSDTGTAVARLERDGEPKGDFALPPITDVATLAYDPTSDQLAGVNGEDVVVAPAPRRGSAPTTPVPGGAGALDEPSGSTFDPASGTWYVLDAGRNVIVASVEGAALDAEPRTIPLRQLAGKTLRGIAFNPQDNLLYVGIPDEGLLAAVDTSGSVAKTYSLADLHLREPASMAFAPSADPTDNAPTQHLYIADSGDTTHLGGVMEVTLAAEPALAAAVVDDTGTLVQTIDTSGFSPGSPDPSGVTYLPGKDRLELCDSEVEETTGAGYHGVNLWELDRDGSVTNTGTTFPAISKEPNGLGYLPASNTLLISDDSLRRIHLMRPGPDNRFGTSDDVVTFINAAAYGSDDTEDPTYDPVSGHIFFLDGVATEVFRVNPVDGIFGNGNDTMTHFDVGQYGISDTEALEYYPPNDSLIVGNRTQRELLEVTKTGQLLRTIDLSGVPDLDLVSGLTVAPASNGTGQLNYWIVDRGVDNGGNPNENDGKLFEVAAGEVNNTAPVVDSVVINQSAPGTNDTLSATVTAHDDDGDPLTYLYQWRKNGVSIANQTGPTLDLSVAGNGDKGDNVSLRVNAFDGIVQSAPMTSVQVAVVNTNPAFGQNLLNRADTEGAAVSFSAGATDADGDPLTYGATNLPSGVTINTSSGAITGTIAVGAAANSPYSVSVTVRDGPTVDATDTFTWTVADAPVVRADAVSTAEGNTGSHTVTIPVTLSHASASTVTVDWATIASGQPQPGVDFAAASGTVTFVPGDVSEQVAITIFGDVVDEPGQLFNAEWGAIELSSPAHAVLGSEPADEFGHFLIVDDDPPPTITPGSVAIKEGNSGSKIANLKVTLSAPSAKTVTVNWATGDSVNPEPGVDFEAASGTLTFQPGQVTKTVPLTVLGDTIDEPGQAWNAEWVAIVFSSPSNAKFAGPDSNVGFVLIVDDD
jgi:hypothetical protein